MHVVSRCLTAGAALVAALIGGGVAPASAAGGNYSVSYNGQVSASSASPNSSFQPSFSAVPGVPYAVHITVTSDVAATALIEPTTTMAVPPNPLPTGVSVVLSGPCTTPTRIIGNEPQDWDCKVGPGTQTFTATVTVAAGSPLLQHGSQVLLHTSLVVPGETSWEWGGSADVNFTPPPSPAPPRPTTTHASMPPKTSPAQAVTPPSGRSSTAPSRVSQPSSAAGAAPMPTPSPTTAVATSPASPQAPTAGATGSLETTATAGTSSPSAAATALTPVGSAKHSPGSALAITSGGAAACAVGGTAAVVLSRRRRARTGGDQTTD